MAYSEEKSNPWDGAEYSIRAYDYIKGEYRDFKLEEVPPEVFNKWVTWRLGEMQSHIRGKEDNMMEKDPVLEEIKEELKDVHQMIVNKEYNSYVRNIGLRLVTILNKLVKYIEGIEP